MASQVLSYERLAMAQPSSKRAPVSDALPLCCHLFQLVSIGDDRGRLVAIEGRGDVPFAIARRYYVHATTAGTTRGMHAHRLLDQLAVAVSRSCTMLLDDGTNKASVRLDDPAVGLLLGSMIWREMTDFSRDFVLMVMASAAHDEADYIRDYAEFKSLTEA